jgi:hypothetical protein
MPTSESNPADNRLASHALMAERQIDIPLILRQLRLCRSTLGSVLELLESDSLSPVILQQIGECSMDTTADIERLWNLIRPSI